MITLILASIHFHVVWWLLAQLKSSWFQCTLATYSFWVYPGVRTCELFLCFVAIVRVRVYYVDFFVFFVLRHWWVSQVFTPRMSPNIYLWFYIYNTNSGAPAAWRAAKLSTIIIETEPHVCIEIGTPCNSFFMVPPKTTTSCNMAAIQLIPSHAVLDFSIHLWY